MESLPSLIWVSLVWLALVVCIFLVWFYSHRAKHKERLMMLEKGMDPNSFFTEKKLFKFPWLKIGIVIIGLSVGLMIIALLASLKSLDQGGNALPLAILGLCGGISMVIANRFNKSNN